MSDELALLAAIRDNPGEDTPRLAYADWLDEHATSDADRARAEFIRVRLASNALYPDRDRFPERYRQLEAREQELQDRYADDWLAPFHRPAVKKFSFSASGLLNRIHLDASRCDTKVVPPWHREPFARVVLEGTAAAVKRLTRRWLNGVTKLDLKPATEADADQIAEIVAQAPFTTDVTELNLWHDGFSDRALRAVATGRFERLEDLSYRGRFTPAGWRTVLSAAACANLTELTILGVSRDQTDGRNRGVALAEVITGAPVHAGLKFLWLGRCALGGVGLARLAKHGRFEKLTRLCLDDDSFGPASIRALGEGGFPVLEQVRLSDNELEDPAVSALADARLPHLTHLDLSVNRLTGASAAAVVRSAHAERLIDLDLSFNEIRDIGATALATAPFNALEELHLSSAHLTDKGADALRRAAWASRLQSLYLSYNNFSEAKVEELTRQFGSVLSI